MENTKNIIEVKNVTFTYHEADHPALTDLSFTIKEGSWTAIIGHNGSGKSTLARILNGLLVPDNDDEASVIVNGVRLTDDTVWTVRNDIGIVFQNPDNQFVGATVADDVAFGMENRGVSREEMLETVARVVKQVRMDEFIKSEPARLSGGQKQRVAIAGILAIKPKVIILDESTSMLDPEGKAEVLNLIKQVKDENDLTVISITHDIEEASGADNIIVLNDGQIVQEGTPKEIFQESELLEKLGLAVPFVNQLISKLKSEGIEVPASITNESELTEYLWNLNSNM